MIGCHPVQKNAQELKWNIAAEIPAEEEGAKSIGYAGPVAGTHNDVLFIGGGANYPNAMPWLGGKKKYHNALWVYHPATKIFQFFRLPFAVAYPANASTPRGVISAGGENETGILSNVFLTEWISYKPIITTLPALPIALTNAAATSIHNKIYVAGGETKDAASAALFQLDLDQLSDGWKTLAPLPKPTSHAVLVAVEDNNAAKLFLAGGRKKNTTGISDLYASLYEYDIASNSWTEKKSLPYSLSAGTGMALNNEFIVLFGGDKGETFRKAETLISKINNEKDSILREQLNKEKIQLQSSHPGFSKEVLWYDIKKDEWHSRGQIPFDVPATTTAVKMGDQIFIPSGEIRAGVRTAQVLEVKAHP